MRLQVLSLFVAAVWVGSTSRLSASELMRTPGPAGALVGTLEYREKPRAPVMLVIPGSGPIDRDGDSPLGIKAQTYKLLAIALAREDITTLRIDKRGLFGSKAAIPDPNDVTIEDYDTDVHAWVTLLRRRTGARCVWVLGHSEGGLVALLAAQHGPGICGVLLVATPGRPLGDVLRSQLRANPANAPILPQALSALRSLEAGRRVDGARLDPALMPLFRPAVQRLLISELALDPAALIARLRLPVLVLQGERDLQVGTTDAQLLARAGRHAKLELLPGVNHVLKLVQTEDRAYNLATYSDPDRPVAPDMIKRIAAFVRSDGASR